MGRVTCGHTNRKNFSKGDCQQCAQKKYAQRRQQKLREKQSTTKPERINPETELTRKLRTIYNILRSKLLPLHPVCEGKGLIHGCTHKATEIHHAKGRIRYLLILSRYFKYLCHNCHEFCTEHSAEAKEMGLSMKINSKTEWTFTELEISLLKEYEVPKR